MPSMRGSGPVSLQGFGKVKVPKEAFEQRLKLRVIDASDMESVCCEAHTATAIAWKLPEDAVMFIQLAGGSDCVLQLRFNSTVPRGCLALTAVQQYNLRIASGHTYEFSLWQPPEDGPLGLCDMDVEVRQLSRWEGTAVVQVDGGRLSKQILGRCFGCIIAVNEGIVMHYEGVPLVIRVTKVNNLEESEQQDVVGYHCYRGQVTPNTQIYIHAFEEELQRTMMMDSVVTGGAQPIIGESSSACSTNTLGLPHQFDMLQISAHGTSDATGVNLLNCRQRPPSGESNNYIHVTTNDGEWFPVPRVLLRSCIKLTSAVRSTEHEPRVNVDIDTLTFDRILIFLEAEALGRDPPNFALHLLDGLAEGAEKLGLKSLQSYCQSRWGAAQSQTREYSLEDVRQANAQGNCWIIIDGMVLDVTHWLDEHPGGSTIIPKQSLNVDATRFFEVYHASRESFLYLNQFYIGELSPDGRSALPCHQAASHDFLMQLRHYTTWRMAVVQPEEKVFKSF